MDTERYNADLAGRGITLIEPYTRSHDKRLFRCQCGHEWRAVAYSVRNGSGCPACAKIRVPQKRRLKPAVVEARAAAAGFTITGYTGTHDKATFCCPDGHTWTAIAGDVLDKRAGCPHCAGRAKLDAETINARLAHVGIRMTGPYLGATVRTAFRCACGHCWEAQPASLYSREITGCPKCSDHNSIHGAARGFIYVLAIGGLTKIGITSQPAKRLGQLRQVHGDLTIAALFAAENGADAFRLEQATHRHFAAFNAGVRGMDGATELFTINPAQAIEHLLALDATPVILPPVAE